MKILHVITSMATGGAEKLMVDLLPRLIAAGAEVDLLLFDGTDTPFRREIEKQGIRVLDFGCGGSVYNPLYIWRLCRLMNSYDIVHTHNYAPQIFGALGSLFGSTILCTTEHTTSNRRRSWKCYAPVDRWMYRRYRRVICISEKTEAKLRSFINSDNDSILTINNGIDVSKYATAQISTYFKEIFPDNIRVILQVARFGWEKDQDTMIKAMPYLSDRFRLVLVGDGPRRHKCEQLAAEKGMSDRVCFLGVRSDVPSLMKASDYIAVSSHVEGFGLVAVEGMAAGRPVLASDVDGLREVVKGAGILFPHGDSEAFAREILRLEADAEGRDAIIDRCRVRASYFDINSMARAYMNQYTALLDERGG